MADIVDKSGGPTPLDPASAQPTPQETGSPREPADDSRRPRNSFENRIAELVRKNHENDRQWRDRYEAQEERLQALEQQLAEKNSNGNGASATKSGPLISSFADIAQADLDQIIAQGQGENPALFAAALKEDRRRWGEELLKNAQQSSVQQQTRTKLEAEAWNDIRARYGKEVDDDQSELWQRANRHMAQLKKTRGQGISQDWDAQRLCFALAHHDLHARDPEELQSTRREMERMKQSQAMETGIRGAQKLNDEVEQKLKQRDIKGALRQLEMVQDLRRE